MGPQQKCVQSVVKVSHFSPVGSCFNCTGQPVQCPPGWASTRSVQNGSISKCETPPWHVSRSLETQSCRRKDLVSKWLGSCWMGMFWRSHLIPVRLLRCCRRTSHTMSVRYRFARKAALEGGRAEHPFVPANGLCLGLSWPGVKVGETPASKTPALVLAKCCGDDPQNMWSVGWIDNVLVLADGVLYSCSSCAPA